VLKKIEHEHRLREMQATSTSSSSDSTGDDSLPDAFNDVGTCVGDVSGSSCLECIRGENTKICAYENSFDYRQCCNVTDFDNICGASEPGVQCSNTIDTSMKYFLCPQESIKCGGETIVIVPSKLAR